ncbi:GDSL-type esterase/lipase family protein [Lysinibacillus sphaericus]|uniref:GDSL-type esterase/lipase family protein n=1 Tax=Lysinibacillus sphaericus TaxID=1421 RepID=UPI00210484B6|nr:GDSL-type esterase/lipase family protein [Lysinibacillus sp. SDF0037]
MGATVKSTLDYVEEIASRRPSQVFLSIGQNDLGEPLEEARKTFVQRYTQLVDRIRDLLSAARIYVLSITPVDAASPNGSLMNQQIETYNVALQKMAQENGIDYIDLAPIFQKQKIQFDKDGSHFTSAFYPILLDYLNEWTDLAYQLRGSKITDSNEAYKVAFRHSVFLEDPILGALPYLNKLDSANAISERRDARSCPPEPRETRQPGAATCIHSTG